MRIMPSILIKIGGSTVNGSGFLPELAADIASLDKNTTTAIVHGGGKDIAKELERLNKEFTFIDGQRVTDAETMGAVQRVLSGDVNKRIVNCFLLHGVAALGISGVDGGLLTAEKLQIPEADLGFVGTISAVNNAVLETLYHGGFVPVISPVSRSVAGDFYNINADLAASEIAIAQKSDHLIFISDVPGVMIQGEVQSSLRSSDIEAYISSRDIHGGMIPKMRSAIDALSRGVQRVHICSWDGAQTLTKVLATSHSWGTTIYHK